MRFFFTGPRVFGIRPGISLGASDFRKAFGAPRRGTVPGSGGTMTGSFVYVIEGHAGHHKIGAIRFSARPNCKPARPSHFALPISA